jgi:triosephosphate isomerase
MRKRLVAGNWKMNKTYHDAMALFETLNNVSVELPAEVDVMIAPPAPFLSWFAKNSTRKIEVGAQDLSHRAESEGAYTGEVSAEIIRSAGVRYAIVGHSERRAYHAENDELISQKIAACIRADLKPIYCCGESLDDRQAGRQNEVVRGQIKTALSAFSAGALSTLIVAYEPVWAIGTGKTASPDQAQEMHAEIRKLLDEMFGSAFAANVRILYGGSVKPANAAEIFGKRDVDGGLIGGAALQVDDFIAIVKAGL